MPWCVSIQHWAGWVEGWGRGEAKEGARVRTKPPVTREKYPSREAADKRCEALKQQYPDRSTTLVWVHYMKEFYEKDAETP
jgi:hypothetical protein